MGLGLAEIVTNIYGPNLTSKWAWAWSWALTSGNSEDATEAFLNYLDKTLFIIIIKKIKSSSLQSRQLLELLTLYLLFTLFPLLSSLNDVN